MPLSFELQRQSCYDEIWHESHINMTNDIWLDGNKINTFEYEQIIYNMLKQHPHSCTKRNMAHETKWLVVISSFNTTYHGRVLFS